MSSDARAFWLREPGVGEIRPVPLREPGPDDVLVRTLDSGVSRGTETLVFRGGVPTSQYAAMRAPFQEGDFPAPVKYGYLSVGVVERGPGGTARPHRLLPVSAPDAPTWCRPPRSWRCPTTCRRRARCWPAPWRPRSTRCGTPPRCSATGSRSSAPAWSGCCVARLLARFPGARVTLVDVDPARAEVAAALGVDFALPADAADGQDLVVHASATSAGLQRSLDLLAPEGTVLELSWYGDTEVSLSLGGAFHSGRLGIRASQVGTVAAARRGRRTTADRLALALDLLRDPAFDALITGESRFDELPDVMARLAAGSLPALCHTVTYGMG